MSAYFFTAHAAGGAKAKHGNGDLFGCFSAPYMKNCGFWRGLFWLLCRFRSRIRRMATCGIGAGVEAKCGQEGFCGVYFLSGAASGFFAPVLQEACRESGAGGRLCNTLGRVLEAIQESVMGCLCTRRFCKNGRKSWILACFLPLTAEIFADRMRAVPGLQRHTSDHACTQDASGALAPICFT